jgi:hypothetical protein
MDCEYCFAGKGEYHGAAGLMSYETGKAAMDYLVANSPGRTNLEVDFFGGEPLLNWEVVKQLVAYGRSIEKENGKNFRFTLTTNGLLLDDEVIEFCNRTQVVYLPNTEKPDPVTLKFHETEDQYVGKFIKYCLRKNFFDERVNYYKDSYNPYRYIDWIKIHVWDNNLKKKVMTHIFESCRISTYDYDYNLDYTSSQALQPSIAFSFINYKIDMNPEN